MAVDSFISTVTYWVKVALRKENLIEDFRGTLMYNHNVGTSCTLPGQPTIDDFDNIYESVRYRIIQSGLYPIVSIVLMPMRNQPWFPPAGLSRGVFSGGKVYPETPEMWLGILVTSHLTNVPRTEL
jgi:hypothetical protein